MQRLFVLVLVTIVFCIGSGSAVARAIIPGRSVAQRAKCGWRVDHYLNDALLRRSWAVLVDCRHPDAPARMVLLHNYVGAAKGNATAAVASEAHPQHSSNPRREGPTIRRWSEPEIRTGDEVEVANPVGASARFLLSGRAIEPGYAGETVRVRLNATRSIVRAGVQGPHLAVLIASGKPSWRRQ